MNLHTFFLPAFLSIFFSVWLYGMHNHELPSQETIDAYYGLKNIIEKKGLLPLAEIGQKLQDPTYTMSDCSKQELFVVGLVDEDGQFSQKGKSILTTITQGNGLHIKLVDYCNQ